MIYVANLRLDAKEMDTSRLSPTPMYNAAILEDISLTMHHQILTKVIQPFDNVRGALILLKVFRPSVYFLPLTNITFNFSL